MDATNTQQMQQMQQMAAAGRSTDTVMAHLTLGEVVVPRDLVEDPEVRQVLESIFQAYGIGLNEFTVGDPANKINPETGHPEFFKKFFKRVASIALPILGTMIPGVGPIIGGALGGAAGGAVSGGGIKNILSGAALGGLGGYATGGAGNILGKSAGATLAETTGNAALQGPTLGTGIKGAFTGGGMGAIGNTASILGLSNILSGGGGMSNIANIAKIGGSLYSAKNEDDAAEKARNAMINSVQPYSDIGLKAQEQLSSNLESGFDPGDIASDPGYQFRLKQGQDALNASLAASGMSQSGAAIKAAQDYAQDFAKNEYSSAYDRWLAKNSQLGGLGQQGLQTGAAIGNTAGMSIQQAADRKNKRLSEILSGLGYV